MKLSKKVIAALTVAATVAALGATTASAARRSFHFDIGRPPEGSTLTQVLSEGNPKDDDEQRAYVHTESGNVNSGDYHDEFYISTTLASPWVRIDSNSARYIINYNEHVYAGESIHLEGKTDKYNVESMGYWYS